VVILGVLVGLIAAACGADTDRSVASNGQLLGAEPSETVAPPASTTTLSSTTLPSTAPPAPAESTTTTEPRQPLVIHAAGDTNLDPSYIPALAAEGYEWALSGLDGLFVDDDLTLVNLECVPSDLGERQDRPFNFRCDPAALASLAAGGVEVVTLGNNHSLDYGPEAVVDGVANLTAAGMEVVGAGADRSAAFAPALIERNGWTIAVLGFGALYLSPDWLATDDRAGISDGLDLEATTAAIEQAAASSDLVIVTVHWCCELDTTPNARNQDHARAWLDAGADIVVGHHHHRLQPLDLVDGHPVAWGLGNFVWPRLSAAGSDTAVARIEVAADGTMTACLLPVTIVSNGHPALDDPEARSCPPPATAP
jgi:poly-gamma-glutamate synthesis protein (capsule biosynthesis protein)